MSYLVALPKLSRFIRKIFTIVLILYSTTVLSQSECDTIYWSRTKPLTILDFKSYDTIKEAAAFTLTKLSYNVRQPFDSIIVTTSSYFLPCLSWIINKNASTLAHEQLHFDICEYSRRSFLQKIKETGFTSEVMQTVVKGIFRTVSDQRRRMEMEYDRETISGSKADMQIKWKKKIDDLLSSTNIYVKPTIALKVN